MLRNISIPRVKNTKYSVLSVKLHYFIVDINTNSYDFGTFFWFLEWNNN